MFATRTDPPIKGFGIVVEQIAEMQKRQVVNRHHGGEVAPCGGNEIGEQHHARVDSTDFEWQRPRLPAVMGWGVDDLAANIGGTDQAFGLAAVLQNRQRSGRRDLGHGIDELPRVLRDAAVAVGVEAGVDDDGHDGTSNISPS